MTHFDDELEYVCAWGRWRIDQARNEPTLESTAEERSPARRDGVAAHRPSASTRRGRARLRLVADGPAPLALVP